jgi:glucose/mannose-6-phosphate isomerase
VNYIGLSPNYWTKLDKGKGSLMINLDDVLSFAEIDPQNMLEEIDKLPDQLITAWDLGKQIALPAWDGIKQVAIVGMGGSAIGADLLNAYASPHCPVPVGVIRDYDLPAWARGKETLVIASSHSGNTEETLSAFDQSVNRGCRTLAICTGGKLAVKAQKAGVALCKFSHKGQPRAAVGYSFGILLAVFVRLGFLPDAENDLRAAVEVMKAQQEHIMAKVPVLENSAKRLAGQCINRWVSILASDFLTPVARRWKGQVSELAKTWGQFEFLPEADHNTLAGVVNPEDLLPRNLVIFLQASKNHPRNQLRTQLTKEIMMLEGLGTDFVHAQGDKRLAQMWSLIHFGDYFAYYLAMLYGANPTPVEAIEGLKERMEVA